MKLRKILGLALCASIFSFGAMSCSDDDNKDNGNDVSVISGTWKHTKTDAEVEVTKPEIKEKVVAAIKEMNDAASNVYAFKLDSTFKAKIAINKEMVEIEGKYTLKDNILTLKHEQSLQALSYKNTDIIASEDVKEKVAEKLEIDKADIKKAIRVDTFSKITK